MRRNMITAAAILSSMMLSIYAHARQNNFPFLEGPYLGQKPPGVIPTLFAPGVISVDSNFEHSAAVFSPDKNEVYWCTNVGMYTDKGRQGMLRLYFMKMVDGKWTAPRPVESTGHLRVERPVFSPDGNRLYIEFGSNPTVESNTDIYVMERIDDGWSTPKSVSPLINSSAWERLHSVTSDGSMYFTRNLMTPNEEILVSRFVNGGYTEPEKLGESYNSRAPELAMVFGPGEEYMLVAVRNERHTSDLYVSYRKADGTWTERIKTPYYCGGFLAISPDGKYLFMLNEGICWISTSFVDELKLTHGYTE